MRPNPFDVVRQALGSLSPINTLSQKIMGSPQINKAVTYVGNSPVIKTYRTIGNSLIVRPPQEQLDALNKQTSQGYEKLNPQERAASNKFMIDLGGNFTGSVQPVKQSTKAIGEILGGTDDYLKELVRRQQKVSNPSPLVTKAKGQVKSFLAEVKEKLVDASSPIEDVLNQAEKQNKFKILPKQDIRLQIDRVLRSKTLASKFAEDNGLVDVIRKAPDLDALNQYMIAKQAKRVEGYGVKTGRNLARDNQLIQDLGSQYEPLANQVSEYTRKLLKYSVDTGLVDPKLADELVKKYPEYVPLNRVFDGLEKKGLAGVSTKPVASLSKQTVVQKLKGSTRDIVNPIESILTKTQDAFNQGERNVAARQLASYKDLPGLKDLMRETDSVNPGKHTFSYLDNGVKKVFETTPEIEAAAKSLSQEQLGLLGKIFAVPTRMLQLGATGLNLPFVATNALKDQMTMFVNSNKAARTSLLNPINFGKALFEAVKHGDLYDEVVRNAAGGTSFDIAREAPGLSVARIRAGKNVPSKIKYTVTHPAELLRAVEDIVGRGEELGRIQQYRGTKQALLKEGRTLEDSMLLGAKAARENTANFARKGSWGRVLNGVIPFFNAGIQGSRQLVRSFQTNPKATTAKLTIGLFMPMATATTWNLSDPERKQIYEDIPQYEKENNIIIIPPGATADEKGRYNVIKIPIPPGLSNLTTLVRRPMEQANGLDPVRFKEVAANILAAGTSIDVSNKNKLLSSIVPQGAKVVAEPILNKNFFTGQDIVPSYMQNLPPEAQVRDSTSGAARTIGGLLNISPLKVENTVRTAAGGLGTQLLGIESPQANIQRRLTKASGGQQLDKLYDAINKFEGYEKQVKALVKEGKQEEALAYIKKNQEAFKYGVILKEADKRLAKLQKAKKQVKEDKRLTSEQRRKVLNLIDGELRSLASGINSSLK